MEEQIRGGFAVRDVLGAEDPAIEPLVQAGEPERVSHMVVGAARCDARGQRDPVERLKDSVHWRERVCERLAVAVLDRLVEPIGKAVPEVGLDLRPRVSVRAADEPVDHLALAERPAQLAQHLHIHFDGQALAVDQHAIAIEDHEFDRTRHQWLQRLVTDAVSAGSGTTLVSPVAT